MKKNSWNLLNKHIIWGGSFVFIAAIASIYWGYIYAEDTLVQAPSQNTFVQTAPSDSYLQTTSPATLIQSIPAAPSLLSFKITSSGVVLLTWVDNAENEDKFNIERRLRENTISTATSNWSLLTSITKDNVTSYEDTSVIAGAIYDYRVQACLSLLSCSEYSAVERVQIPISVTAIGSDGVVSCNEISLTLKDGKTNYIQGDNVNYTWTCRPAFSLASVFIILEKPDKTVANLNNSSGHNTSTLVLNTSNLAPGNYILKACFNSTCEGGTFVAHQAFTVVSSTVIFNDASTSALTSPQAPTGLSLYRDITLNTASKTIPLKWIDNSNNEDHFILERRLSLTPDYLTASNWMVVNSNIPRNISFFDDVNVTPGTMYDYRIKACIVELCSLYSVIEKVLIPIASTVVLSNDVPVLPNTTEIAPSAPSNLTNDFLDNSSTYITLRWRDSNTTTKSKYAVVSRKTNGKNDSSIISTITTWGRNYFKDENIKPGIRYDYSVKYCYRDDLCSEQAVLNGILIPVGTLVVPPVLSLNTIPPVTQALPDKIEKTVPEPQYVNIKPASATLSKTNTVELSKEVENISLVDIFAKPLEQKSGEQERIITNIIEDVSSIFLDESKVTDINTTNLVYKDTNKDGISDFDSKYFYNIDPVKPSLISSYYGKNINASEKILLGYDPTKKELVKITKELPILSGAQIVKDYKVNKLGLIEQNKISIAGQALPNSYITVYIYSTPIMVTIKADNRGEWEYILDKEMENGDHTIYVATVNNTGNIIAQSSPYTFIKSAEAVTLLGDPITDTVNTVRKPGVNYNDILIVIISFVFVIGISLIIIGFRVKKNIQA